MSKSMSDVYSGMMQKHIKENNINVQNNSFQTTKKPEHISESIIDVYRNKKSSVTDTKKTDNSSIVKMLNIIKEAIESNPISAKREVEKLINELQK